MRISANSLLKLAATFEKYSQITAGNDLRTMQNLFKHTPYNFGGKSGTLYGTLTLHNNNETKVSLESGVMNRILSLAVSGKIVGPVDIKVNISNQGAVSITGQPTNFITQIHRVFAPLMQDAIARLRLGQAVDKDFPGIKLPAGGFSFEWIKLIMPADTTQTPTIQS